LEASFFFFFFLKEMVVRLLWLFSFAVCVCAREFIVMFDQMSHWKNLVELIGHCEDWAHVHRQGVQVTDFIVVDIAAEDYSCFRNATRVKHFGPNQMIRKNVLANEDKGRAGNDPVCVYKEIQAERLWNLGITGKGIRVAIFDTGLGTSHPHFSDQKIVIRTDWTNDGSAEDSLGHGTIVAGIIGADPKSSYSSQNCKGIAPDAELLIFKVFNSKKQSFTSWFLDAFNYALALGIDILNLSIGGPDFLDSPFVDKINELSANNIIVVSAIGNDGPTYGTLNNPADQMDVLGVGGVNENDEIAEFSSRGMTTWEISSGYGRVKPDIVTHSKNLMGSSKSGDSCKKLSGTSVASPIIAGALALLLSSVPAEKKDAFVNPAVARQILIESADLITSKDANIFEQGSGKLNLNQAYDLLKTYSPRVSAFPSNLNLVDNCPYFWPYCVQPLFKTRSPLLFNLTILNAIGVTGRILDAPVWMPDADFQDLLSIQFSYPKVFWPWTGYLSIKVGVNPNSNMSNEDHLIATGRIMLSVVVETLKGVQSEKLEIPVKVKVIATPPRSKRILWDQFHQLRYPSGFFPKDNLDVN
jgi:membrane-bound transcription factor site-1 protease